MTNKVWKHIERPELGLLNRISLAIREYEDRNPGSLGAPTLGNHIIVASDYGGEHSESASLTYAFVIADLAFAWLFLDRRKALRQRFLKDNRRMAYKNLNDRRRRQALIPFLHAADSLPGTLCILCVDKTLRLFDRDQLTQVLPEFAGLSTWKSSSSLKLLQAAYWAGLFLGGLSAKGQNVTWITDDDEFTASPERIILSTQAIGHVMSHLLPHDLGRFFFGPSGVVDTDRQSEDLVAVADLAAGALADAYESIQNWSKLDLRLTNSIRPGEIKGKARLILQWLADTSDTQRSRD